MVAELQIGVDQADAALQIAPRGDGGVDRERGRAHAALCAIERNDAALRRVLLGMRALEAREQAAHAGRQLLRVDRLRQVVVGARAQREHLRVDVRAATEQDDRRVRAAALRLADAHHELHPGRTTQVVVAHHQVGPLGGPLAQTRRPVGRGDDVVPVVAQHVAQLLLDGRLCGHELDSGGHDSPLCLGSDARPDSARSLLPRRYPQTHQKSPAMDLTHDGPGLMVPNVGHADITGPSKA